jgi:hypothetical protein
MPGESKPSNRDAKANCDVEGSCMGFIQTVFFQLDRI